MGACHVHTVGRVSGLYPTPRLSNQVSGLDISGQAFQNLAVSGALTTTCAAIQQIDIFTYDRACYMTNALETTMTTTSTTSIVATTSYTSDPSSQSSSASTTSEVRKKPVFPNHIAFYSS